MVTRLSEPAAWDLRDPALYVNRETSWLRFNHSVLEEALDPRHPLLERVKFLSIFGSNLDEFFMIRVSGLRDQLAAGTLELPPDGLPPAEQLAAIRRELKPDLDVAVRTWLDDLRPQLEAADIRLLSYSDLRPRQRLLLRSYFEREIFPVITPLAFDPAHPFPHIANLALNLAVVVRDPALGERFARVKVPNTLPRLLRIPSEERAGSTERLGLGELSGNNFVWMEEVIAANLDLLFPGLEIVDAYPFRVTRDADLEIEEDEASDLLAAMAESVEQREFGSAVRLEVDAAMPETVQTLLAHNLKLAPYQVYTLEGVLGLADLIALANVDRPDLKDQAFAASVPAGFDAEHMFSVIRRRDVMLYHPYDSFAPVIDFVRSAARDPAVLAIKQTMYRVGPRSPIVDALLEARERDKQVAVVVELKARFDEENNIEWARALEKAGVHVVFGLVGFKVHAKLALVVRKEAEGIARYVHFSTGNYNSHTSRVYTDLGYFTADPEVAADVTDLFNALTGYARPERYRKLIVSPIFMRQQILAKIEREIQAHARTGAGRLAFKLNNLSDPECIQALYRASQAGVQVDLQVRAICCLRPGVPGLSETIRVTSVVGRFLEHSRIYYFANGGEEEEIFLGSADLMPRNLDGRVEALLPVSDPKLRRVLIDEVLEAHLRDTVNARRLDLEGEWHRVREADGFDSQLFMLRNPRRWNQE